MLSGGELADLGLAVSRADPGVFWGIIIALCPIAVFLLWRSLHNLHCVQMINDVPTSRIRSAPQGYVELSGRGLLMDGPAIVSPISGRTCVWYRYRVEGADPSRRGAWEIIDSGESTEVFWLEDGTGRVAVDPEGAEVTAGTKAIWYSDGRRYDSPGRFLQLLVALGTPSFSNTHRYIEERIDSGTPLFALGMLHNTGNLDNGPDIEEQVGDLLVEWKKNQAELMRRFDLNHDGEIDEQEWMLARQAARREVLKSIREQQSQPDEPFNLMQRTRDPHRPYLISTRSQGTLAQNYRVRAILYLASFVVMAAEMVWLLSHRLSG